jgi:LysR family hydrogen peroxide-inducible transcriptional activator
VNLRDLTYLVTVAEHLHFGKAAAACNVSQPTLSMQLKKLEDEVGAQIFERTNKSVMLTATGREIALRARRVLHEVEQIRQIARSASDPLTGDLRIGVFPTLAPYLLPALVPKMKQEFPGLNLLLVEDKTADLLHQLEEGSLDCALLAMPVSNFHLSGATVFREDFLFAVPVDHPLANRTSIHVSELENRSLLLLDEGHCMRDQALMLCRQIGGSEAMNFRATSLETLRHMVAAGNAVTLIPRLAVRDDDPLVRYIPFCDPVPSRVIGLYWRKTSARAPLYAMLRRHPALWPK